MKSYSTYLSIRDLKYSLPVVIFCLLLSSSINGFGQVVTHTFTSVGSSSWTVPNGVTSVTLHGIGGGGGGGNVPDHGRAGGGGGGAYDENTISVFPGQILYITVGSGGGSADNGSASKVGSTAGSNDYLNANGGSAGGSANGSALSYATGSGGAGGTKNAAHSASIAGGHGAKKASGTGTSGEGGGGGGAAGPGFTPEQSEIDSHDGLNGYDYDSNSNGDGGKGGENGNGNRNGKAGNNYGGGGGGAYGGTSSGSGGSGAQGIVWITYNVNQITRTAPSSITGTAEICQGEDVTLSATGNAGGDDEIFWNESSCPSVAYMEDFVTAPASTTNISSYVDGNGVLVVSPTNNDPMINMYSLGSFNYQTYRYFQIRYRVPSGNAGTAQIFFRNASNQLSEDYSVRGTLINDGAWHVLTLDAGANSNWNSNVTGWRFDPTSAQNPIEIDYIALTNVAQVGPSATFSNLTAGTHTYYATRINKTGFATCSTKSVIADPTSVGGTVSSDQTICYNASASALTVSGHTGNVQKWQYSTDNSNWTDIACTSTTLPATSISSTESRWYRAVIKSGECSSTNSAAAKITVNNPSAGTVSISGSTTVCAGNSTQLTASTTGNNGDITYTWNAVAGLSPTSGAQVTATLTSATTYTVTATATIGFCTATATQSITVEVPPTPTLAIASTSNVTCPGGNNGGIDYTISSGTPSYSVTWDGGSTSQNSTGTYHITNLSTGTYSITITDANGCSATQSNITISQPDTLHFVNLPTNLSQEVDAGQNYATINLTDPQFEPQGNNAVITRTGIPANNQYSRGDHTISYSVTNDCGETINCSFTITVYDNILPVVSCPVLNNMSCYKDDEVYDNYDAFVAAGGSATPSYGNIDPSTFRMTETVSGTNCNKSVTRTYYIKDQYGKEGSCSQTFTILDNIKPTFTCPDNITIYKDGEGNYNVNPSITGAVADETDNCSSGLEATYSDQIVSAAGAETIVIERTWSLSDECGNAADNQVQTITIKPVSAEAPQVVTSSWTAPRGTISATFEAVGGGGGGVGIMTDNHKGTGGGGGGAYAKTTITSNSTISVHPGDIFSITTGQGGQGGSAGFVSYDPHTAGGDSYVTKGDITVVLAKGGGTSSGGNTSSTPGIGGQASECIGDVKNSGGNGGSGHSNGGFMDISESSLNKNNGGGGGGAAGPTSPGGNGGNATSNGPGAGGVGHFPGGNGGDGVARNNNGNDGSPYGGGGSGTAQGTVGSQAGGNGANGVVMVSYVTLEMDVTFDQNIEATVTNMPNNTSIWYYDDYSVISTTTPVCANYTFMGWYYDQACTQPFVASGHCERTSDITLYADWQGNFDAGAIVDGSQSICVGAAPAAIQSQTAASGTSFSYQWQVSTDNGSTFSDISGATNESYTPSAADYTTAPGVFIFKRSVSDGVTSTYSTGSHTLTVNVNPSIAFTNPESCPNNNEYKISANITGNTINTYTWSGTDVSGNTAIGTITRSLENDCNHEYAYSLYVLDINGCSATKNGSFTPTDTVKPTITVVKDTVLLTSTNCLFTIPDVTTNEFVLANDNCGIKTINQVPAAGTECTVGTNIMVSVFDKCDNFSLVVIRAQVPALLNVEKTSTSNVSCHNGDDGEIAYTISGGTPQYNLTWEGGSTTKNAPGNYVISGLKAGKYTVLITDANGCTQTITDTIKEPEALHFTTTCPSDMEISCDLNKDYATKIIGDLDYEPKTNNPVYTVEGIHNDNQYGIGEYHIKYRVVNDCYDTARCQFTLTVLDKQKPTISCPPSANLQCENDDVIYHTLTEFITAGGTATDNQNKLDTSSFKMKEVAVGNACAKTIERTYYIADLSGNTDSCTQTIEIHDDEAPDFTRPVDIVIYKADNGSYDVSTSMAGEATNISDNCTTTPVTTYSDKLDNSSSDLIITRTWKVVDNCGNRSTSDSVQIITVKKALARETGLTRNGKEADCLTIKENDKFINENGKIVNSPRLRRNGGIIEDCDCDVIITVKAATTSTIILEAYVEPFTPTNTSSVKAYTTKNCTGTAIEGAVTIDNKTIKSTISGLSPATTYYIKVEATDGTHTVSSKAQAMTK